MPRHGTARDTSKIIHTLLMKIGGPSAPQPPRRRRRIFACPPRSRTQRCPTPEPEQTSEAESPTSSARSSHPRRLLRPPPRGRTMRSQQRAAPGAKRAPGSLPSPSNRPHPRPSEVAAAPNGDMRQCRLKATIGTAAVIRNGHGPRHKRVRTLMRTRTHPTANRTAISRSASLHIRHAHLLLPVSFQL